jgi:hypothetical protein
MPIYISSPVCIKGTLLFRPLHNAGRKCNTHCSACFDDIDNNRRIFSKKDTKSFVLFIKTGARKTIGMVLLAILEVKHQFYLPKDSYRLRIFWFWMDSETY